MVQVGPYLVDPVTWFWAKVAFGVYFFVGVLIWFFYAKDQIERGGGDGRGVEHILTGLLHGLLWPIYVALALFAWSA